VRAVLFVFATSNVVNRFYADAGSPAPAGKCVSNTALGTEHRDDTSAPAPWERVENWLMSDWHIVSGEHTGSNIFILTLEHD
jgi:hypothetical protein